MVLVSIFFVSGADAASVVMGTLSQRGSSGPHRRVVIFWGAVMGAVAAVMLLANSYPGREVDWSVALSLAWLATVPEAERGKLASTGISRDREEKVLAEWKARG